MKEATAWMHSIHKNNIKFCNLFFKAILKWKSSLLWARETLWEWLATKPHNSALRNTFDKVPSARKKKFVRCVLKLKATKITCSIRITAHTSSLILQRRFPPLLRLGHISQIIDIDVPSCCCNHQPISDKRKRINTFRLWVRPNKSTLLSACTSGVPTLECFIPTTSDQLPWYHFIAQESKIGILPVNGNKLAALELK